MEPPPHYHQCIRVREDDEREKLNGIKQTVRGVSFVVCVHVNINCHQLGCCIYQKEGSIAPTWKEKEEKEKEVCVILNISLRFLIFSLSLSPPFKIQKKFSFSPLFSEYIIIHSTPSSVFRGLGFFFSRIFKIPSHTLRIYTPIKKKGEK